GNTQPIPSNLILQTTNALDQNALQQKFIQACKDDGHNWCLEVQRMDNPALGAVNPGDAGDTVSQLAGGLGSGTRLPLMMYKVYVNDGHKELVRGGTMQDLTVRTLRNIMGIGNNSTVYNYLQNAEDGLAGRRLARLVPWSKTGFPAPSRRPRSSSKKSRFAASMGSRAASQSSRPRPCSSLSFSAALPGFSGNVK